MKRSKINQCIREMEALIREHGFALPPFCHWTPEEWKEKGEEYDEIRDNMLGWDITDYGQGDFVRSVGYAACAWAFPSSLETSLTASSPRHLPGLSAAQVYSSWGLLNLSILQYAII